MFHRIPIYSTRPFSVDFAHDDDGLISSRTFGFDPRQHRGGSEVVRDPRLRYLAALQELRVAEEEVARARSVNAAQSCGRTNFDELHGTSRREHPQYQHGGFFQPPHPFDHRFPYHDGHHNFDHRSPQPCGCCEFQGPRNMTGPMHPFDFDGRLNGRPAGGPWFHPQDYDHHRPGIHAHCHGRRGPARSHHHAHPRRYQHPGEQVHSERTHPNVAPGLDLLDFLTGLAPPSRAQPHSQAREPGVASTPGPNPLVDFLKQLTTQESAASKDQENSAHRGTARDGGLDFAGLLQTIVSEVLPAVLESHTRSKENPNASAPLSSQPPPAYETGSTSLNEGEERDRLLALSLAMEDGQNVGGAENPFKTDGAAGRSNSDPEIGNPLADLFSAFTGRPSSCGSGAAACGQGDLRQTLLGRLNGLRDGNDSDMRDVVGNLLDMFAGERPSSQGAGPSASGSGSSSSHPGPAATAAPVPTSTTVPAQAPVSAPSRSSSPTPSAKGKETTAPLSATTHTRDEDIPASVLAASALDTISAIESAFRVLEEDFVFPTRIEFTSRPSSPSFVSPSTDQTDRPAVHLAFTATNAPLHYHLHALASLLAQLDAVDAESAGGEAEKVRARRRAVVERVEGALVEVEGRVEGRKGRWLKEQEGVAKSGTEPVEEVGGYDVEPYSIEEAVSEDLSATIRPSSPSQDAPNAVPLSHEQHATPAPAPELDQRAEQIDTFLLPATASRASPSSLPLGASPSLSYPPPTSSTSFPGPSSPLPADVELVDLTNDEGPGAPALGTGSDEEVSTGSASSASESDVESAWSEVDA